jgi:hypothetical protein
LRGGKRFIFSIIDDTDDAFLENIRPIYDFLYEKRMLVTKTIWVYPPRDKHSKGDSLQNPKYLEFVKDLKKKGFEIGLHNVGSGDYTRQEIIEGLEEFRRLLREYPKIQINHSYNKDSIYGGYKRFNWPIRALVKMMYPQYAGVFQGEEEESPFFWGDKHKEIIQFNRNHETDDINTIKYDRYMPYIDPKRSDYVNYWFSATFAPNQWIFNRLVTPESIRRLEKENGTCIIFTHLGYYMKNGQIDPGFAERIEMLSRNPNGVYVPVSRVLATISHEREASERAAYPVIPLWAKFWMEVRHLWTRFKYRKLIKLDDYAFKALDDKMFTKQ